MKEFCLYTSSTNISASVAYLAGLIYASGHYAGLRYCFSYVPCWAGGQAFYFIGESELSWLTFVFTLSVVADLFGGLGTIRDTLVFVR